MVEFEIWQGGIMVASVSSEDPERAFADAMHYAMMYSQDGAAEIREVSDTHEFEKRIPRFAPCTSQGGSMNLAIISSQYPNKGR